MKVVINKGRRRLGIPGRPALILDPNQSASVSEEQLVDLRSNRTTARWLETGVLVIADETGAVEEARLALKPKTEPRMPVKKDEREEVVLPEGVTGTGVERYHVGGGWWEVYVNGVKVTDSNVRKDESLSIAAEYE